MPRIEDEVKLDFADVLSEDRLVHQTAGSDYHAPFLYSSTVRPKRSTIKSRSEVDLSRTYVFRNKREWTGVPIISANMDTTGRFEIGKCTCIFQTFPESDEVEHTVPASQLSDCPNTSA